MGKSKSKSENRPAVQMFRPMQPKPLYELAQRVEAGFAASDEYNYGDVSMGDLNGSRFSAAEYKELFEKGRTPALYHPALVSIAKGMGCDFGLIGQESKRNKAPKNWPSALGEWKPGRYIGPFRTNHDKDLRRNVTDPDNNLVESGQWCIVLGDSDKPAIFNVNGSTGDNSYAHNCLAAKSLAFAGMGNKLGNLFIRLNTKARIVKMTGDGNGGAEVVCLAYQAGEPGYIERDGKKLTADQVRKAFKMDDDGKLVDSDAVKALKWVPLDEPIIGQPFTYSQLVQKVAKSMDTNRTVREGEKATAWDRYGKRKSRRSEEKGNRQSREEGVVTNMRTQTRTAPQVSFCFGLRHALSGSGIFYACWGDTRDDKRFNVALGVRCGDELTEADRKRVGAAAEAAKVSEPKAAKPKRQPKPKAEPKAEPKAAKPKAAKPKAPKADKPKAAPKPRKAKAPKADAPAEIKGEPAAPVSDTADSGEPATTEPATVAEPVASGS